MIRALTRLLPRTAALTLVTLVLAAVTAGPASAAVPPNDDFGSATVISALPFSTTLDTSEATPDDDPVLTGCGGPLPSVWYEFTPPVTGDYDIIGAGSDYTPFFTWYNPQPFLNGFSCGQGSMRQQLPGGQTFYLQVSGTGGHLELTVRLAVNIELTVTLDPTASLGGPPGSPVTVSGTVSCSQPGLATVDGTLDQTVGSRTSTGTYGDQGLLNIPCSTTPTPWSRVVTSSGRFLAKPATVTVFASACDELFLGCHFGVTGSRDITIRR